MFRSIALLLATTLPLHAQIADPLPEFDLHSAISCLAFTVVEIEQDGRVAASRAEWLVFFSRLIAAKSTEADSAVFDDRFSKELAFFRDPSFEDGEPVTPDEVDEILTGTGKMCWFNAIAAEAGPAFEE
jgi:hypothetical protein